MAKYESEEGKKDSSHEPKDRKEKLDTFICIFHTSVCYVAHIFSYYC